jgi:hypothetical protein
MSRPTFPIRIIMQRRKLASPWADEVWETHSVIAGTEGEPGSVERIVDADAVTQYLVSGWQLELFHDEAEGYFLNIDAPEPRVFVMWRKEEGQEVALPVQVSVSYNEAARRVDSSENVDAVPMPQDVLIWLRQYVQDNYRPEQKKKGPRRDKPSFEERH